MSIPWKRTYPCLLPLLALAFVAMPASHAFGETLAVPAPCKDKLNWRVLRSCDPLLNGIPDTGKTSISTKGWLKLLENQTQARINGFYLHKDGDKPIPERLRYCNLVENRFVPDQESKDAAKPDKPVNHVGEACGAHSEILVELQLQMMMGCVAGGSWKTYVDNCTKVSDKPFGACPKKEDDDKKTLRRGSVEGAYMRSGQILANACYFEKIAQQVKSLELQVTDTSSCYSAAKAVLDMEKKLSAYNNVDYDIQCTVSWDPDKQKVAGLDEGEDKQVAQLICAMRAEVEAAWLHLADCEVSDRAFKKYMKEIGDEEPQQKLYDEMDKKVTQKCGNSCAAQFGACSNIPTTETYSACVNRCYRESLSPFMKDYLKDRFRSCDL